MTPVNVRNLIEEAKLQAPISEELAIPFLNAPKFTAYFFREQETFGGEEAMWYHLAIHYLPNQFVNYLEVLHQFLEVLGGPNWWFETHPEWGIGIVQNLVWKADEE